MNIPRLWLSMAGSLHLGLFHVRFLTGRMETHQKHVRTSSSMLKQTCPFPSSHICNFLCFHQNSSNAPNVNTLWAFAKLTYKNKKMELYRLHPQQVAHPQAHQIHQNPPRIVSRKLSSPQGPGPLGPPTDETQGGRPPIARGGQQHNEGHQQGQADSHGGGLRQYAQMEKYNHAKYQ